jgi:hypothetical protein
MSISLRKVQLQMTRFMLCREAQPKKIMEIDYSIILQNIAWNSGWFLAPSDAGKESCRSGLNWKRFAVHVLLGSWIHNRACYTRNFL